jgi:bacillithiol biosynthesis cysteine-adding enzyme BshC
VTTQPTDTLLQARDAAGRASIDLRRFPWMRRFALDYAYDFAALAPFFAGNPADRPAWDAAIDRVRAHHRAVGPIAEVIGAQQARRDAPTAALEAARSLADPRTVAVVTGQQAGLFGGPLFTLLKALTALKLAERVSREHQTPAVAVFWIDAEDHDWEEVRSCAVLDETLTPRAIALPSRAPLDHGPVARVALDTSVTAALDELRAGLPATEFREALLEQLAIAYAPGRGMAEAFGRWLEQVLGSRGLVVYDCSDPRAKALAADLFVRELSSPGDTSRLAARAGDALRARGYHAQVEPASDHVALFHLDPGTGARRAVHYEAKRFLVDGVPVDAAALLREAAEQPARFSPNVLLRPIVQDTLFPTICYVAGPNELAYLGQLKDIYAHFGVPMPLMFPRASATLVDSAALRFLGKYGVALETLQPQDEAGLNALLASQIPPVVEETFSAAGRAIDAEMTRVVEAVPAIDPTLQGAARSTLGRMQHDLQTLHGKMIQAAKRRDDTLRRQYIRTRALAFPAGHPQERAVGFVSFLNQYGPALIDRLDEELPLDLGHHWLIAV